MVALGGGRSSLVKMLLMCLPTALSLSTSCRPMPALERPSAISGSTSLSRGVSRSSGSLWPAHQELGDDLGVQRGAAGRHPAQRVEELVDVARRGP